MMSPGNGSVTGNRLLTITRDESPIHINRNGAIAMAKMRFLNFVGTDMIAIDELLYRS